MLVPVSGGASGTFPESGHSTVMPISPNCRWAPVASKPRGGPSRSAVAQAAQPGPGPGIPVSYTRRTS